MIQWETDFNMKVELIAVTKYLRGNRTPEELLEHAGRVCYRSEKRGEAGSFLQARIREGHESIVEHASLTFEISEVSRACSHQLVRHRIASYSQESQRYVDLSDPELVVPPSVARSPEAMRIWEDLTGRMREAYRGLRRLGIRKEDSRFLLPHATATRIVVTMNFRELRHFFKLRCDRAAQWEIRALAKEMLKRAYRVAPSVFQDLYTEFLGEGAADA
jgi:thymidylate synthase (FAD)